jgi:uncharacterized protein (TIGR02118 family)
MVRLMVVYPRTEGHTFDGDYWVGKHMAVLDDKLPKLRRWEADLAGPDTPYHAVAHLYFDSAEDLAQAMSTAGGQELAADVANYTSLTPTVSVHEIVSTS